MTLRAATPELIGQRVRAVLAKRPDAEVIGLRAEPRWPGGTLAIDGRRVVIEPCTSPLSVRSTLADWAVAHEVGNGADLLVVLCDLADADLGADVLARFTPAQILGLEPWNAVKALFGVVHLDAAFTKNDGWIADALLTHVPGEVARPKVGGEELVDRGQQVVHVLLGGRDVIEAALVVVVGGPDQGAPEPGEGEDRALLPGGHDGAAHQGQVGLVEEQVGSPAGTDVGDLRLVVELLGAGQ